MASLKSGKSLGEELWRNKMDKMNAEFFILTYGSIVAQLLRDLEDTQKVNWQLEEMGYRMGARLVEEFIVKSGLGRCRDFRDTADVISKVAFKMFLNVTPNVFNMSPDGKSFSLVFDENPLSECVQLPAHVRRSTGASAVGAQLTGESSASCSTVLTSPVACTTPLWYSNVLCGAIRGSLEALQLQVEAYWVSDQLLGDEISEMHIRLVKVLEDEIPPGED